MIRSRRNTANTAEPEAAWPAGQARIGALFTVRQSIRQPRDALNFSAFSAVACAHACALSGLGAFGDRACRQTVRTAKESQRRRRRLPLDAKGSFIRVVQLATSRFVALQLSPRKAHLEPVARRRCCRTADSMDHEQSG